MNSTFIPASDLKDLSTWNCNLNSSKCLRDVNRLRQKCGQLRWPKRSLQNIRSELAQRRIRSPKP